MKTAPGGRTKSSKPEQKVASLGHTVSPVTGPLVSTGSDDEGSGSSVVVVTNVLVVSLGVVDVELDGSVEFAVVVAPVVVGPVVPLAPVGPVGGLVDVEPAGLVGSPTGGFTETVGPTGLVGDGATSDWLVEGHAALSHVVVLSPPQLSITVGRRRTTGDRQRRRSDIPRVYAARLYPGNVDWAGGFSRRVPALGRTLVLEGQRKNPMALSSYGAAVRRGSRCAPRRHTLRFMIMHKMTEAMERGEQPDPAVCAGVNELLEEGLKSNVFISGEGLERSFERVQVVYKGGKRTVTEGPLSWWAVLVCSR